MYVLVVIGEVALTFVEFHIYHDLFVIPKCSNFNVVLQLFRFCKF